MIKFILVLFILTNFGDGLDVFKQSECGKIKSCLRWSSCNLPYCDFGFSWKAIEYNFTSYLEIELVGRTTSDSNGYLAFGVSNVNKMVDNGVVYCYVENDKVDVGAAYNGDHSNHPLNASDLDNNFLIKSDLPRYGVTFDAMESILRCRFLRLVTPIKEKENLKDLSGNHQFFLLFAKGKVVNHKIQYHRATKKVSLSKYDLLSHDWVDNIITTNYILVKIHACLMIFGWIFLATNGIIIAKFYKGNWTTRVIFKKTLWFQIHRLVQIICVTCVCAAFIVIFVHVGGFSTLGTLPNSAHPIMGIVATGFLLVNPIMALFRCHPDHSSRWIFNRLHFMVGITAYVLAICTITIGIQLPPAGPNLPNINYPWILVVVYLGLIIILFTYGEIKNKSETSSRNEDVIKLKLNSKDSDLHHKIYPFGMEVIVTSMIISFGFGITFIILVLIN